LLKFGYKKLVRNMIIYNSNKNDEKNFLIYEELKREGFKNLGYEKYLDSIYFSQLNMINITYEIKIIKNGNYVFKPKVSVIISIYTVEEYIIECLDSISNQTLKDIEIICINIGSSDNSLHLIKIMLHTIIIFK
jgi:hypothetical protein